MIAQPIQERQMDVIDAAAIRGGESGNSCGGGGCMGGCRSYVSLSWIEGMGVDWGRGCLTWMVLPV